VIRTVLVVKEMLRASIALLMLMAVLVSSIVLIPLSTTTIVNRNRHLKLEGTLTVLAVIGEGVNVKGIPLRLSMKVTRGEGNIFLSLKSLTSEDFQASVKLAILIGTMVAGKDYSSYDYYMELEPYVGSISGPSAGAAIATLVVALLNGLSINESIAITGIILPDITIGPVGGLLAKIKAAGKAGVKVAIVPSGQLIIKDPITNTTINVMSVARKYGLKVKEASNLYEVLKILGGKYGYLGNASTTTLKPSSILEFRESVMRWINEFNKTYVELLNKVHTELNLCKNETLCKIANKIIKESRERFNDAFKEFHKNELYASVSDLFSAIIPLTTAYWLLKGCIEGWGILSTLVNNVSSKVSTILSTFRSITRELNNANSISINKLSLGVEVLKRIHEANITLNMALSKYRNIRYENISSILNLIEDLSYAYWRADSALKWYELFNVIRSSNEPYIKLSTLKRVVELLTYYSKVTLDYMHTLIRVHDTHIIDLYKPIDEASKLLRTNPIYSLSLNMDAIARISALLSASYSVNMTKKALTLRAISLNLAYNALSKGFKPLVTLTYIERGDSLLKQDPYLSIYFYDLALTNTMWYLMLIQAMGKEFGTSSIMQLYQRVNSAALVTTLLTLTALVAGFIIGYNYCRRECKRV